MSFDKFYNEMESGEDQSPLKPFYSINTKKEKEVHKWIKQSWQTLMKSNEDRIQEVTDNYKLFKGEVSNRSFTGVRGEGHEAPKQRIRDEELFVNYMKLLVDEQVNKITEVKPALEVVPVHNEHDDKVASKISKAILDTRFYEDNFDGLLRRVTRRTKIAGEDYLHIFWNPFKGKQAPQVAKGEQPLLDEMGNPEKDPDGNTIKINKNLKIGEVDFELVDTRHLYPEPVESEEKFKDANWVIRLKKEYVHDLRLEYPDKAAKIKSVKASDLSINGMTKAHLKKLEEKEQAMVLYFYHKKHRHLKDGYFAKATPDCVLEMGKFPYDMETLPFVKRDDKVLEDEQHAQSFMHDVKAIQSNHVDTTSMILQNMKLCSQPKWFVEQGSVSVQSLGSGRTIVQTRPGAKAPVLSTPTTVNNEVFKWRADLTNEMRLLSTGGSNAPGLPPTGITAGVALQFLSEQENKRYNTDIAGHFDFIKESGQMVLSIAHQFYDESDERYLRLLGKNNEHTATSFKAIDINGPYDIRLSHSTGLPETKAARIQTLIDLNGAFEGLFTKEQLIDQLEMGDTNKMYDQATAAVKCAESILEDLLQGNQAMEPQKYHNYIVFWKIFVAEIQKRSFSEKLPDGIRQTILDYIGTLEMLMVEKANVNQVFAAELATLALFPIEYILPPAPVVDPAMMDGTEGAPGTEPLIDPAMSDGSEQALPDEEGETMMNKRSDAGY